MIVLFRHRVAAAIIPFMPLRTLRFCPQCLLTRHATAQARCRACDQPLQPLLDDDGALSRAFLSARGNCCDSGCRNCPYPRHKTCEKCGQEFQCMKTACWCEHVHLSNDGLQWLRRSYRDCLCPSCLASFAANPPAAI